MDVLKYFYEEPASLEVLTPDLDPDARQQHGPSMALEELLGGPRYYRGYLAGRNLDTNHVGVTALAHPEAFVDPLMDWLDAQPWTAAEDGGPARSRTAMDVRTLLSNPGGVAVLACGGETVDTDALIATTRADRRRALDALRHVLEQAEVVFFREPAHHGHDWSLFSARPLRAPFVEALRRHPHPDVRRFVLPFQRARSEHKFYFETWQLNALPEYVEEV
jgi:hypothetical protein